MKKSPLDVSKELLKVKFPNFEVAFVAGSFNRGEATATSDIDLVVILPEVEAAWRESVIFENWPIEIFVHDKETLKYFFYEVDAKSCVPSLPNMVSEAPMLPENSNIGGQLKILANEVLTKALPKFDSEDSKHSRYFLSDLLDDLKAPRNKFEGMIIAANLHDVLSNFLFRSEQQWSAKGKHIPRQISKLFPELYRTWEAAFTSAFNGDFQPVIDLTKTILQKYGGYTFDGYKRIAPKEWRSK